jgi:hypothetical protein
MEPEVFGLLAFAVASGLPAAAARFLRRKKLTVDQSPDSPKNRVRRHRQPPEGVYEWSGEPDRAGYCVPEWILLANSLFDC